MSIAAGWYPDPYAPHLIRYWSGEAWTDHTSPAAAAAAHGQGHVPVHPEPQPAGGGLAVLPARTAQPSSRPPNVAAPYGKAPDVWLPAGMLEWGHVPPVCAKHGRRASRMGTTTIYSRTPLWVIPVILVSLLIGLIVALAMRRTVTGSWPFCPECETSRRHRVAIAWGGLATVIGAIALAVVTNAAVLILVALVAGIVAAVYACLASWTNQTCADVDRDSGAVHVRSPSASFVAALPRL